MASALALNEKVDLKEEIKELKKAFAINIDFIFVLENTHKANKHTMEFE